MIYERDILPKQEQIAKRNTRTINLTTWLFRICLVSGLLFCVAFWVALAYFVVTHIMGE